MIKTFLSALSVILFVIPIIAYSFFPSSNLNIWLSTRPILAQIYAFPLATATMASILSFVFFPLSFYKKNKQIRFYSGILLLLSLILLLFGTDKTLSSASNKTKTLKLVTWNSQSPKLFNATIDHILLPKNHYYVKDLDIVSFQNSDHRCIFTEITF